MEPIPALSGTAPPTRFATKLNSSPHQVREALSDATSAFDMMGVASEDRDTAELVLAEAMNNIVEHAYGELSDGWISLSATLDGDELVVELRDGGKPMPGLSLPEGRAAELTGAIDDLPEGGFGWFLIRSLTTELSYLRLNEQNILSFVVPVRA